MATARPLTERQFIFRNGAWAGWPPPPIEVRFWAKVDRRGDDECWPWQGATTPSGYGQISYRGKLCIATQVALLEFAKKPRPSALHVACHTCDNPICVNPAHLWWGTRSDNTRDSVAKGRARETAKTHCGRGHPFSGPNLVFTSAGWRDCRACRRLRRAAYRSGQRIRRAGA